jgi:acetoacetyl-CoA synthetase
MQKSVWKPTEEFIEQSNLMRYMKIIDDNPMDYASLHRWSVLNPNEFWLSIARFFAINFHQQPKEILNDPIHFLDAKWFSGAKLNFAEHLLKRRDDTQAIAFYDENNQITRLTFNELYKEVASIAKAMKAAGIVKGDRVAAILPNMPETIIAMLAASSIGAVWSSCSPDFGTHGIMDRFEQIKPKLLIACDGYFYNGKTFDCHEKLQHVANSIDSIEKTIIVPFLSNSNQANDAVSLWSDFKQEADEIEFASLPFDHPLYILFSSGTTGKPKCIVHGAGGTLLQHLKELSLHSNLGPKDNLFFFTTCGWMMWNWMVSALALGTKLTLYDGCPTYPDVNHLFQIIEKERVTAFGTSAKFISAVEKKGLVPSQSNDLSSLKTIFSTGSPLLPYNYDFVYEKIKPDVQLCSISGGTDIISCFALGNPLKEVYRGELQCLGLGMAVEVLSPDGRPVIHEKGELVCTKPFPSMPLYFWNDEDNKKYFNAYFSKFNNIWSHGDYAEITANGGLIIYGRSDAILNPGGVRIGTAEIYRQVEKVEEVIDSVVIGQEWQGDVRVVLFVKLEPGRVLDEQLNQKIKQTIRANTTPRHVPALILQVNDIPKTVSGKTVELAVKNVVHGIEVQNIDSLANPEALEEFKNRQELCDTVK